MNRAANGNPKRSDRRRDTEESRDLTAERFAQARAHALRRLADSTDALVDLLDRFVRALGIAFEVHGFGAAFLGALVISAVSFALDRVLRAKARNARPF